VNPRIDRLHRRFASQGPKARYLASALILEGSLVAMSLLIVGSGSTRARPLSQSMQIETAERKSIEPIQEEMAEPNTSPPEEVLEDETELVLTRFFILDREPLDLPRPKPEPALVEPQAPSETWLHRIHKRPLKKPPDAQVLTDKIPSQASKAQIRLEPLEGQSPKPQYPPSAIALGLEGSVRVRIHFDAQGKVTRLDILQQDCPEILLRSAKKALLQWRFPKGPGTYEKHIVFRLRGR
jgi:TonB family protein